MIQIKSKKTGLSHILSKEEYATMVAEGEIIKRFDVVDVSVRPMIIPAIKTVEVKKINKKKE